MRQAPSTWNVANALTGVRVLFVPLFAWLLLMDGGDHGWPRLVALGVFLLASFTDRLDGQLARRRGIVTDFGKVADPLADKALVGAALIGLSWLGELPWWVTALILGRELGVSLLRIWVIRYGVIPASRGGKAKTVLQTVAVAMYLLPFGGLVLVAAQVVMAVAVVLTVATGMDYLVRALRMRAGAPRSAASPEQA